MSFKEGYLLLATGPVKYLEMARNLAASLRIMDGKRRICLVHDEAAEFADDDHRFFDDYAVLPDDPLYPGFMNKIRLFPTTPYQRTMFVDADCLLLKRDIDLYWQMSCAKPFAITGERRTEGEWKGADIAKLLRDHNAPYLIQMNSGVFCFDDSPETQVFFEGLNHFYMCHRDTLGVGLHRGSRAQTDEIYIGMWMGLNGMDSVSGRIGENSWMVSTWRAFWFKLDPRDSISILRKPKRSIAGIPNPIGGWDRISPSFVHFICFKPARRYCKLALHFRTMLP